MTEWLNKLKANSDPNNVSRMHDLTKPCLIYKKASPTLADCSILNNHELLKTAFIKHVSSSLLSIALKLTLVLRPFVLN